MADERPKNPAGERRARNAYAVMSSAGFEFLAAILLPGALGYWLDGRFGLRPWLMIAGGAFGFCVGLYRLMKTVNEVMR